MIKTIASNDLGIIVSGQPGPYHSGHVVWDGAEQKFRVMDTNGSSQDLHGAHIFISMGNDWQALKDWIFRKQAEERELAALCRQYPNLEQARQEFEIIKQLVQEPK